MKALGHIAAACALFVLGASAAAAQDFQNWSNAPVAAGQTYERQLTNALPTLRDGSYVDCVSLPTVRGRSYTITMRSRQFDTYLMVIAGPCSGNTPEHTNDDFESGNTDSQIRFQAAGDRYAIILNSYGAAETGRYTLTIQESAGAAASTTQNSAAAAQAQHQQAWNDGWTAFERQQYAAAARLLRPYADAGDPSAQNAMGYMSFYGHGVPRDRLEAGRWYGLAAEQGHEASQRTLNQIAPHIMEARFVDHIDRYGPDTTDVGTFHYDVSVYCIYSGPNCSAWRARAARFQRDWNNAAEAANMRRIWGLHSGGSDADFWRRSRERSACMRRVTESIERQTYGQQTWRYVNNCN
ncbi:MAG: sel1 repeat family protein [Terricaulis sp.]|nr:sel1 repeat family protein [Terricaulis sp.]